MEMTFNAMGEWTLTDDKIIIGKGKKEVPLSSILTVEHHPLPNGKATFFKKNGVITITCGIKISDVHALAYSEKQNDEGVKAAEYISNYIGSEECKKAIEERTKDIGKRCNVCGKFICYTYKDIERNEQFKKQVNRARNSAIVDGLFVSRITSNQKSAEVDQLESQIIDYNKCPSCGSRDLIDLTDEDISRINAQQNGASVSSSADELKIQRIA